MPFPAVDLSEVHTYPLAARENLVDLEDLVAPGAPPPPFDNPELAEVAGRIAAARRAGRPVIASIGAHVVKRGLAPVLIELMERGVITHLASNGAATIHDFEIALMGHTSEDVAASLADGSFGMAEETGALMNGAVRAGARDGLGMGEALGRALDEGGRFPQRARSLVHTAYRLGIPYTVHVALGTDIIHQHPACDFAALGWASGQDFRIYTASVSLLEGGVFCNFGSAVIGPEVFLKALSIARNLGHTVRAFTTANFDLVPLGDYRRPIGDDVVEYYYRPRKNIVNRPVAQGGRGYHITGDHRVTIPNLAQLVRAELGDAALPPAPLRRTPGGGTGDLPPAAAALARDPALAQAFRALRLAVQSGGTLFVCGDGLNDAGTTRRPIPVAQRERLARLPGGEELAGALQRRLRTLSLPAGAAAAQALYTLARPGDALVAAGDGEGAQSALAVARALGLTAVALNGDEARAVAMGADVAVHAPGEPAALYGALLAALEADAFGEP